MKNYLLAVSILILLCAGVEAQENSPAMWKLGWIAGCWKGGDKVQTEEQWTKPAGQSMLGVGRTIKDGKTEFYEFLQIREQSDGIFYIAQPNGGKTVSFKLVKVNDNQAIFENAQHDFPQRIVYQRTIDGSLLAALEGMESGKVKRVDFSMKRIRCD
ncbi:MAG: DUF6265 family protein [Acidobacteriota bacterium]